MDYFDYAFTLLMIFFPAVFTLFFPGRDLAAEIVARGKRLRLALWSATLVCAAAYLLLARWQPAVGYFIWMAFFPLWFNLAMPLLRLRNPAWRTPARDAVRSASLVRRDLLPPALRFGWIALGAFWALLLGVTAAGFVFAPARPTQWWLLAFNLAAGFELWILHWAMRRSLVEPEPAAPGDSEALRRERESFRRFKLNAWFLLAAVAMLIFSLPPLLLAWYGNDALGWAIAIGAGGGTLAGIGGGVFGTWATVRRARINQLYLESSPPE